MLLQLLRPSVNINLIQVQIDQRNEHLFEQIRNVIGSLESKEIILLTGDFNSKVVRGATVTIAGLGERNDCGDMLMQFCHEENLFNINTFHKLHPRWLYTPVQ